MCFESENEMRQRTRNLVFWLTAEMTDDELATLITCARSGLKPQAGIFDTLVIHILFTEDNGTKMHTETILALAWLKHYRESLSIK